MQFAASEPLPFLLYKEYKSYSTLFTDMLTLISKQKKLQVPIYPVFNGEVN